jgi:hypothetical protein
MTANRGTTVCDTEYSRCASAYNVELVSCFNARENCKANGGSTTSCQAAYNLCTQRPKRSLCDTNYRECLESGGTVSDCTRTYNTCITDSGTSIDASGTNAPSSTGSAGTSAAGAGRANQITGSGEAGLGNADYLALRNAVDSGKIQELTPGLKAFLKSVQTNISSDYPDPTQAQLDLASGGGLLNGGPSSDTSNYSGSTTTITPDKIPPELLKVLLVKLASQKGTQAEQIQQSAPVAPSLKDQIRDDVRTAVQSELDNIRNEYEVKYVREGEENE